MELLTQFHLLGIVGLAIPVTTSLARIVVFAIALRNVPPERRAEIVDALGRMYRSWRPRWRTRPARPGPGDPDQGA